MENVKIWTKSTTFVLPMLGRTIDYYYSPTQSGKSLINCYIGDVEKPETIDKILLLFEYNKSSTYQNITRELKEDENYMYKYNPSSIDILDMMVFSAPERFENDLHLFKLGKYSKLSRELKIFILGLNKNSLDADKVEQSEVFKILTKKPDRKTYVETQIGQILDDEAELFDIPDLQSEEIFNIHNFKYIPKYSSSTNV